MYHFMWLWLRLRIGRNGAREANDSDAQDHHEKREPLVGVELPVQKYDAEQADEQHESAASHLVDACRDEEKAHIHQRCACDIAAGGQSEEDDTPAHKLATIFCSAGKEGPDDGGMGFYRGGRMCEVFVVIIIYVHMRILTIDSGVAAFEEGGVAAAKLIAFEEVVDEDEKPAAHFAHKHLSAEQLVNGSICKWSEEMCTSV